MTSTGSDSDSEIKNDSFDFDDWQPTDDTVNSVNRLEKNYSSCNRTNNKATRCTIPASVKRTALDALDHFEAPDDKSADQGLRWIRRYVFEKTGAFVTSRGQVMSWKKAVTAATPVVASAAATPGTAPGRSTSSAPVAVAQVQYAKEIKLDGVDDLFRRVIVAALLQFSADHANKSIAVEALGKDTFKVTSPDQNALESFTKGQQGWWKAHQDAVAAIAQKDAHKKYASKAFPNFEEPVVDVWAVVVLFNPVYSNLDQRCSRTVNNFWKYFQSVGGDRALWEGHIVFLDLVPLLDSGKQPKDMNQDEEKQKKLVMTAAKEVVFASYATARIDNYAQAASASASKQFPVILCAGKGGGKQPAIDALKDALTKKPEIQLFDGVYHPTANEANVYATVALERFLTFFEVAALQAEFKDKKRTKPTAADVKALYDLLGDENTNLIRWATHVASFQEARRTAWGTTDWSTEDAKAFYAMRLKDFDGKLTSQPYVAGYMPSKADAVLFKELFGTNQAVIQWAALMVAKSAIELDVKVWEESDLTDLEALAAKIKSTKCDGLLWGEHKLVPVGFRVKKLRIQLVVEDDKVSSDHIEEMIMEQCEEVQSIDVVAWTPFDDRAPRVIGFPACSPI